MSLNPSELAASMFNEARKVLSDKWEDIEDYAETETKKLAASLAMIEKLKVTGRIDEEQARLHLDIQKNAARSVLLTIEGLGILAVEGALNAALAVVKDAVNAAVGFALL